MSQNSEWPDMSKIYANSAIAEESIKDCDKQSMTGHGSQPSAFNGESMDGLSFNQSSSYHTLSQMESSTAAPSMDGNNSEEDVDDDEIFAWVASGMLPVNTSTTLALNQAYQEVVEQFMGRIEGVLTLINERQKVVQNMIDQSYITEKNQKIKKANKIPVLLYVCPYFRDAAGLCPGLNKEANRMREEHRYFDMLVEQRTKWTKSEKSLLKKGVASAVRQAYIAPLQYKKELLFEKSNADDMKVAKDKKCAASMKDIDKQIAKLSTLTDSQLLSMSNNLQLDWNQLASECMETARTAFECRATWVNSLLPHLDTDGEVSWSRQEIDQLRKLSGDLDSDTWTGIAAVLGTGKTPFDCFEKYQAEFNTSLITREWTVDEDEKLKEAVDQFRIGVHIPWNQIPFFVDGKTREQCQRRFVQCLDPKLRRGRWIEEEDFNCLPWPDTFTPPLLGSSGAAKRLMRAVQNYGERDWSRIADCVGSRSYGQCRERWCLTLNSNFSGDVWTKSEDATLLLGAASFGVGCWTQISSLLPGRSSAMCKQRYKSLRNNNAAADGQSSCITINLLEEESPAVKMENNRQIKRRNHLNSRKERVKFWYKQEHGFLPYSKKPSEVGSFLQSLPVSFSSAREGVG